MFKKTNNIYKFKYLVTGIKGNGIECVYLPEYPDKIYDNDGKFKKTEYPKLWKQWVYEENEQRKNNPNYSHPEITTFINNEWEKRINGYWFFNTVNGVKEPTYITGAHYYFLNHYPTLFDESKIFRDTDKEIFYLLEFMMNDPDCYGICLNTLRRYGKSAIMAAFCLEYVTRTSKTNAAFQGENTKKIKEFWLENIHYPFRNIADYFRPIYDTDSKMVEAIRFTNPTPRGKKQRISFETNEAALESKIWYSTADMKAFDRAKLHLYGVEEAGKTTEVDVYERHNVVKPCCTLGSKIIGKMIYVTTCDQINHVKNTYIDLYYDSDYNERNLNSRTKSGLYAAFLPAYYCLDGYIDEYGIPNAEGAKKFLLNERKSLEDNPALLSQYIRKFPFNIAESFYSDANKCQFNQKILQDRKQELYLLKNLYATGSLEWVAGKDSMVTFVSGDSKSPFKVSYIPKNPKETNDIEYIGTVDGVRQYKPKNDAIYAIGCDPIEWSTATAQGRRSRAVAYLLRKYNHEIDGNYTDFDFYRLAIDKHQFKTGYVVVQYDYRPDDPRIFYEYMIKLCVFYSCSIHVEQQKAGGLISHFKERGYGAFIMNRPEITFNTVKEISKTQSVIEGSPASRSVIQTYTGLIATNVQLFGHMIPFLDLVDDLIQFDPDNTTKHDYSVAFGYTLLAAEKKQKITSVSINLSELFSKY